ncbi:hypothetical protein BpHYR1_044096 [Brachionus plicatilis]|uniref:Uncharacterized protein n=1 Tax=Brachionus plicatilis TaxID=10195 RepID=A0A3M7RNJ1_BRAPC|nr:hypothetical protein BpHYR1_044096 [Brachionus plicatilis]
MPKKIIFGISIRIAPHIFSYEPVSHSPSKYAPIFNHIINNLNLMRIKFIFNLKTYNKYKSVMIK